MLENKKKNVFMVMGLLIVCFLVIGVSYAVWQLTFTQTEKNVVTTGCFKVEFTDQNPITLDKAYPVSDEEGKSLTPYTFTITNTCDSEANYYINLETVTSSEKKLAEKYIKASLKKEDNEEFLNTLNSSYINLDKVLPEASSAYKLYQGVLKANEVVTFSLNLWMDNDTPTTDEVMNATYEGKIAISTSYKEPPVKNLMVDMGNLVERHIGCCDGYFYNVVYNEDERYLMFGEIKFESEIHPYENAVEVVDFSVAQDRSILGYYVDSGLQDEYEHNIYNLYIQADGKIKVNPNASYYGVIFAYPSADNYFSKFIVNGIENLDTSLVTNMSEMFVDAGNVSLDVSHFDTSKVTDMNHMFSGMSNLTSLDLSSFDTRNVTNMGNMFRDTKSMTNLDLSTFDTSKVTDMGYMFYHMNNLTNLDLSSFDTSLVTDMSSMFYEDSKVVTTLTIRNKDVNYTYMFNGAATEEGSQITLNYTEDTESVVDEMIASKPERSNVVKGVLVS